MMVGVTASPGEGFLKAMEPLVEDGNPLAAAYGLRRMAASGDAEAEQAQLDEITVAIGQMLAVFQRAADSIVAAFGGLPWPEINERLAAITGRVPEDEEDQVDYDDAPQGCWATSVLDDEEACDLPAVDELGLCGHHRASMVESSVPTP